MKQTDSPSICYLADASNVHTRRWSTHFSGLGYHVTVISMTPSAIDGVRVITVSPPLPRYRIGYLLLAKTVRRIVYELNPDILHSHYATSYGYFGAITGIHPFIVTAWGSDVLLSPEESIWYKLLVHWVLRRADLVTSMAQHMTCLLIKRRYVAADKILTLPFGVDIKHFNPSHRTESARVDYPVIISTRSFYSVYDLNTLVRAIPQVLDSYPSARFILVGKGPLRADLEKLARELRVCDNLCFLGRVPDEHIPKLLSNADIFISTATSDGNNVSLNEAMACGAFPIATSIPANREWIAHGENGLLFPPGDAEQLAVKITQAIRDNDLRSSAAERNWNIIQERADWHKNMNLMAEHYQKLVELGR